MDMDLVVTRNLQLFIRMAELPCAGITSRMQWQLDQRVVLLEWRASRLLLTCGLQHQSSPYQPSQHQPSQHQRYTSDDLLRLQQCWRLEQFNGVPQRIYLLKMGIMVSCSAPELSGAEFWYQLYRQQGALLRRLPGECR
ncbi:type III secretion system protein [Yersinia pekkanenii]|uniref:Type III secretion system protein SsaM n=1 Tax=Yersinia pekkanenii TaxID=1288385 RepID=A0A0T9QRP4_9GAMM|nr:type III secretion system protein [Yersinia pekkanenii]CNI25163.1 type III secretion system protein SsaM [Yersinia pekkanenii]CRY68911.1 type III secretion system protein SsaM [Yersinia pekkanenii]